MVCIYRPLLIYLTLSLDASLIRSPVFSLARTQWSLSRGTTRLRLCFHRLPLSPLWSWPTRATAKNVARCNRSPVITCNFTKSRARHPHPSRRRFTKLPRPTPKVQSSCMPRPRTLPKKNLYWHDKNMLMAASEDQFRKEVTALANIQGPRATGCPHVTCRPSQREDFCRKAKRHSHCT